MEDARRFFPALQEEIFFPRFAQAAIQAERQAMSPPITLSLQPAAVPGGAAWVFVLPDDRCDLFLLFEALADQCRAGVPPATTAFVSAARSSRSDALWLFREFQAVHAARHAIACSLFLVEEPGHALTLLPDILAAIGADRFVFVGHGILLHPTGWTAAHETLAQAGPNLVFLGLDGEPSASARCFAWSAAPLAEWLRHAPTFIGGFHADNGLSLAGVPITFQPEAACSTRAPATTAMTEAIGEAVLGAYRQSRQAAA